MIKNVLVAADGSRYGDVATRTAAALTKRLGGRLDGLHVIDLWLLRGSFLHDVNGMLGIEPQLHMTEAVEGFLETKATSVVERLNARITEAGNDEPLATIADGQGREIGPSGGRRGYVSGSFFHAIARDEAAK